MPQKLDKRSLIIQAAAECFARYGYSKTTLDDIGRAVRLNKASLYYYFPSKDELFMEVVLQESAEFQHRLAEKVLALASPSERIREYLLARVRGYGQVVNLLQLSVENLRTPEPRFDQLYAYVLDKEVAFLETLLPLQQGPEARRLAALLLTAADSLRHQAIRAAGPRAASLDFTVAAADTALLVDLLLTGLKSA